MSKVSVIMPNYNHAPFLKERIESILAQDYSDIEIILLDDASTDDSRAVLEAYAAHPRVKTLLVNKTNSGNTFMQWQRGLEQAEGEYVWIAESDDVADSRLLSTLIAAMEKNDAVLAFCASNKIDAYGQVLPRSVDRKWRSDFCMDGKSFAAKYLLGYAHICNASAVVFRRAAVAQVNFAQVQQFSASGDRLFWIQLALQGKIAYVAQPLNGFRQHTQKVSGSAENKGLNIQQDHAIYRLVKERLPLSASQRRLICGYHWQAVHQPTVSEEGRRKAMGAWAEEKEFGRCAYGRYLLSRVIDKTIGTKP